MKIKILAAGIALTLPFWACAKDVTIIYTTTSMRMSSLIKCRGSLTVNGILAAGQISLRWLSKKKQKIKRHGFLMRVIILPGHISAA